MTSRWLLILLVINVYALSTFEGVPKINGSTVNGEKFIVVLIPSYNNRTWCRLNLGRLFDQKYSNYHVVYMDDASNDGMSELVQKYIRDRGQEHRVTYIRHEDNHCPAYNLYYGTHLCCDNAIVLNYDGDDWLRRDDVLQIINHAYDDPNVWMTWGQFEVFPSNELGQCAQMPEQVIKTKSYREYPWITSHLRTYYAGLFKQIQYEDFLDDDGEFYPMTGDMAIMYPLLEMANGHFKFIDTVLYVYNLYNPLNDCRIDCRKQERYARIIQSKKKYDALSMQQAKEKFLVS